jgi:hypothetical protein
MDVNRTEKLEEQLKELQDKMTPETVSNMKTSKIVALIAAFSFKSLRLEEVGGAEGVEKNLRQQVESLHLSPDASERVLEGALEGVKQVLQLTSEYLPLLEDELDRRVPAP